MNSFLEKIYLRKKEEVSFLKSQRNEKDFENQPLFSRDTFSLRDNIQQSNCPCVVSEFKRASPSLGEINTTADVLEVVCDYQKSGVAGVSILTDSDGFLGSPRDIIIVRPHLTVPILRKDFVIDPIQIFEARAMGADVILLIAACLGKGETKSLAKCARELNLEVLLEVHSESELGHVNEYVDILGVNNRDLHTFSVSFEPSIRIANQVKDSLPLISESGLKTEKEILMLYQEGYKGFLIGESFMKTAHPGQACAALISKLKDV